MRQEEIFAESEVLEVVRRAAELQEAGSAKGYVPGLTVEELRRMVAEAGIEPQYLEQALAERRQPVRAAGAQPLPGEVERVLAVEVAPEEYDIVTDGVRISPLATSQYGTTGGLSTVGRTMKGQVADQFGNPFFSVTSRGGRTRLRVWHTQSVAAALATLWTIPLVLAPVVGKTAGLPQGILCALASLGGAWLTFRWTMRKSAEGARKAADLLEAGIRRAAEATASRLGTQASSQASRAEHGEAGGTQRLSQ
jgi:hypothetical protein